jgi:hypothetical protein
MIKCTCDKGYLRWGWYTSSGKYPQGADTRWVGYKCDSCSIFILKKDDIEGHKKRELNDDEYFKKNK